jgi:hypothetical protein
MAFCERGARGEPGHHRKFLGRGWTFRFDDGSEAVNPAVGFSPYARHIFRTGVYHPDGGVTWQFMCPFAGCRRAPEAREDKLGPFLEQLAEAGQFDTSGRLVLNIADLP